MEVSFNRNSTIFTSHGEINRKLIKVFSGKLRKFIWTLKNKFLNVTSSNSTSKDWQCSVPFVNRVSSYRQLRSLYDKIMILRTLFNTCYWNNISLNIVRKWHVTRINFWCNICCFQKRRWPWFRLILHEDLDCQQVAYVKLAPYCFLKSGKRENFNLKKYHEYFGKEWWIVSSVAVTTVTFQNGRKLTFNPIYFANELGDPNIFCIKRFLLVAVLNTQILKKIL